MPILKSPKYTAPFFLCTPHLETIIPSVFRKITCMKSPKKIRVDTQDNDFLNLDWYQNDSKKLVILSHGLEGDSRRAYIKGMAKIFINKGWDVMAWNYRGCSGVVNDTYTYYHSGATYDLNEIIKYAQKQDFDHISLIGFSLGGNLTLKYLGEYDVPKIVKSAVTISVPIDLAGSSDMIGSKGNRIYNRRFLKSLKEKIKRKRRKFPEFLDNVKLDRIKNLLDFDNMVTAPLHGFKDAKDYYEKNSSISFIPNIKIPTLVINAANDPFLSESCYDSTNFEASEHVYLEIPKYGGHVGFSVFCGKGIYWSEKRAFKFISQNMKL